MALSATKRLARPTAARSLGARRFDMIVLALSTWFLGGMLFDGWAHVNQPALETFFTPYHAVLYSGFSALAAFLVFSAARMGQPLRRWPSALPRGYEWSLIGVVVFAVAGAGDILWHVGFGIEQDIEAAVSPTHLLLATGGVLMGAGPLRAALARRDLGSAPGWGALGPALLSLTFQLSVVTFLTQYAHPINQLPGAGQPPPRIAGLREWGLVGLMLYGGLIGGAVVLLLRRWRPPFGALTLVVGLNALLMAVLHFRFREALAVVAAMLLADLLVRWLRPGSERVGALRLVAFAAPALAVAGYFAVAAVLHGIWWSVHLWTGAIVLAGIAGLLVSFAALPPAAGDEERRAGELGEADQSAAEAAAISGR